MIILLTLLVLPIFILFIFSIFVPIPHQIIGNYIPIISPAALFTSLVQFLCFIPNGFAFLSQYSLFVVQLLLSSFFFSLYFVFDFHYVTLIVSICCTFSLMFILNLIFLMLHLTKGILPRKSSSLIIIRYLLTNSKRSYCSCLF